MKLWGMIENMLIEILELFIVGINKKILIMLKSVKAYVILKLCPTLKTVLLLIFV